ncbi:MAG: 3-deoxy-7-phosphoheptulonate synthase [Pseudomonadota bacterium]
MILVLKKGISPEEKKHIKEVLSEDGCIIREIEGTEETIIGAVGKVSRDLRYYQLLPGVAKVVPISKPYKLVSREIHPDDTHIRVGNVVVGGDRIVVIAGPCAVESRQQAMTIAKKVRRYGAVMFRGGAFKPRTSPYSFQGLEEEGLKILAEVREETGLRIVTEMTSPAQADLMMEYVDVIQIGARNMQNFELLKAAGRTGMPILLKRGLSATIKEWLMAAEYILSEGNNNVMLCERGIRTFETFTRNTLDLTAVPVIKKLSHLPIIIDPSHATGLREKVSPMARAAIAAGADGLIVEVHHDPEKALSDGPQSLYPEQFEKLMRDIYVIAPVVGKQVDFSYLDKETTVEKTGVTAQAGTMKTVAFLGEYGNYSHKACTQFFGESDAISMVPKPSFRDVFEAVKNGTADLGAVPLENSLTGSIHENYDFLLEYDVKIVGEIVLRIVHSLIVYPGTKIDDIRRIFSHPQGFQQCHEFLKRQDNWEMISVRDTATGVKRIAESKDRSAAAIAGKEAAALYGMEVLKEGVETNPRNFTRFVVIAKEKRDKRPGKKSSLIYSTGNIPGALFETLKIFSDNGINLVKLESRPILGKPWEYMFYVDLEADVDATEFKPVLDQLKEKTEYLKVLGSY